MARHTFTVGDFALFVYFLRFNTEAATTVANILGDYAAQAVCIARMEELVRPEPPAALVEYHPVVSVAQSASVQSGDVAGDNGRVQHSRPLESRSAHKVDNLPAQGQAREVEPLETLLVRGLAYLHQGGGGISDVDLSLRAGTLTIVTGRVGSGKTTLLRALLGLLPAQAGEIHWNGRMVTDPAAFFRPPHSAYVPQVPRLFSQPLVDNILMGCLASGADVDEAIRQAVLEDDVAELSNGLATVVGPRGVRLSGGQMQRTAAARAFIRRPQLLVVDDLSSALDVETERLLWDRLLERRDLTCLAVSHRRAALARADLVIVLEDGELAAQGTLPELLGTSQEMRRLWAAGDKAGESLDINPTP